MSPSTIPPSALTLHGASHPPAPREHTSTPAILFTLSADVLKDVTSAAGVRGGVQFVTGGAPKIRVGKRTIDLTIAPEAFHHELYSASAESLHHLTFAGLVAHRAELKPPDRKPSLGTDAALAALQNTLAAEKQARQAKSVNISSSILREPKNRYEANREQKHAHRRGLSGSQHPSPSLGAAATPRLGPAPTSAPASSSAAREKAMRTPLIHLLAIEPLSYEDMSARTRIPRAELEKVAEKIVQPVDGKWELTKAAYKELDVWNFAYRTEKDKQAAIDNAIRAYDRLRIGKDAEIWQKLLPQEDRGKGIVLSKLNIGGGGAAHLTPHCGASPLPPAGDAGGEKPATSSAAPLPGAGTPRVGAGKSSALKNIIGKTSKQRALEEAKGKKRKEREAAAAASDREGKPARKKQATKTNKPKVKSAELVHDSSEESDEKAGRGANSSQPKPAPNARKPAAITASKPKTKPSASTSPPGSDTHETPQQRKAARIAAEKEAAAAAKVKAKETKASNSAATAKSKAAAAPGKSTPNGLAAPPAHQRHQLSPNKPDHRPTAPSPLGAARPRVASDVSDRAAVGARRMKPGAETPKGLGPSNTVGIRKRHDAVMSTESPASKASDKLNGAPAKSGADKPRKPTSNSNGTPRLSQTNGAEHKAENGVKRPAAGPPAAGPANGHGAKHRKTESGSSHSHKSQDSVGAVSSTEDLERSVSSDSAASHVPEIRPDITYSQGVHMAQRFHDVLYPNYAKLYDEQAAMERRGETVPRADRQRLWAMHRQLEVMKRDIRAASERAPPEE